MTPNRAARIAILCAALAGCFSTTAWAGCGNRPGTPNNLVARNSAPGEVTLNWHPTGGEKCYDIEVSRNGQVTPQGTTGGNCGSSTSVFKGLGYDQNYCFRVRARDDVGTNGCVSQLFSNSACASTGDPGFAVDKSANSFGDVGKDLPGNDIGPGKVLNPGGDARTCASMCDNDGACKAWSWVKPGVQNSQAVCYLKKVAGSEVPNPNVTSGFKNTGYPGLK